MEVLESLDIENYKIYQDDTLYRFTSDAVLLSRFATSKKGDIIADFCSGSGIVSINHYLLTKNAKQVDLIEIQKPLADLSQKTIDYNGLSNFSVYNLPLQDLPSKFNDKYTLILCNPPYKKVNTGETSEKQHIAICKHEVTVTQEDIIKKASKTLKHGGRLCMCQQLERYIDILTLMRKYKIEPYRIQFIKKSQNKEPYLFLVEGTKNVKYTLKILDTIVNEG